MKEGDDHSNSANMPMFVVNTNVDKSQVPAALLSEATEALAKAMGKPEQVGLGAYFCTNGLLYTIWNHSAMCTSLIELFSCCCCLHLSL